MSDASPIQDGEDPVCDVGHTAPGILIAMPKLVDPHFERTVVLMLEHNRQGALGLVLNRPTHLLLSSVLEALEMEWLGDGASPVFQGGPVMHELGWAVHEPYPFPAPAGGWELQPGIHISTSPERLRLLGLRPPKHLRFFLGAAGWSEGQLDWEIGEGVWMLASATASLLFETPLEEMWDAAFRQTGIDPKLISFGGESSD